ncbi:MULTISPECIES: helix-turn-helix domain-containing protein [Halobacterium]|uniref:ArsR/SmtB family transcription factor n=1 Tax=Halobacterium TaxID=2239 RepID=UPI00073F0CCE|nr:MULTISPECIES: helix-turn-helix domain-containing protein [Halobacterium]MCG1004453.1 helix-turn-helix domain-containing protein [Halobacterium noricense]
MSGLLPSRSEVDDAEGEPRVVGVDSEDADRLLSALASGTARDLYGALHDTPATPSELAEECETSLQNAQYHLDNLEDADLVEECDTRYSAKGREMSVYAPADAPVVLFAGDEEESKSVRSALTNLLGVVGVLGVVSLLVQQFVGTGLQAPGTAGESSVETTSEFSALVADGGEPANAAADAAASLPAGAAFFLGGVLALALVGAAWYAR